MCHILVNLSPNFRGSAFGGWMPHKDMILNHLSLTNYKNIAQASLDFSPKLNCVIGANGMGKTNLLDSIYYLSFTKTHIHLPDHMVIRNDAEMAIIEGNYLMNEKEERLFCGIRLGKSKVFRRNKKEYDRIADHIGVFPLVMISPADIELIKGGSIERRKFMDQLISQESVPYLTSAINYRRLLDQRNALLKQEFGLDLGVLNILSGQMATEAEKIMRYREEWLERIRPIFLHYYHHISGGNDQVELRYVPVENLPDFTADTFVRFWHASLERDRALGYTSIGPHRDDLEMLLNGALIRKIGSQGQNKSYMVALKFAQFALLSQIHGGNTPLLLLDDVFDKLDEHRVDRIVQLVSGYGFGQIFMTDTNRKYLDQILSSLEQPSYTLFHAENGSFSVLESVGR